MASFTDIAALIPTLRGHLADDACVTDAQIAMSTMADAEIVAILEESALRSNRSG